MDMRENAEKSALDVLLLFSPYERVFDGRNQLRLFH